MKQIVTTIALIIVVISLITLLFTLNRVSQEEKLLRADIQYRSAILAESMRSPLETYITSGKNKNAQALVDKYTDNERIAGIAVFTSTASAIAKSSTGPSELAKTSALVKDVMDEDKPDGDFVTDTGSKFYAFVLPLHSNQSVIGALMVILHAGYIDTRLNDIWYTNALRLFLLTSTISVATALALEWIIYRPIKKFVNSLRQARLTEHTPKLNTLSSIFSPLVEEVSTLHKKLREARLSASEEARLRLEKVDSPWTAQRLQEYIKDALKGWTIIAVSNREPYVHTKSGGSVKSYVPASGMVTALEPIMVATGGKWIAWGSGDADRLAVNKKDTVRVPPEEPRYDLRRVWLTPDEVEHYYNGFCNAGIWPLAHNAHTRPVFKKEDWETYRKVNEKFADVVISETKGINKTILLIQDFHFALLPKLIKQNRESVTIGIFWHIPWPNAESFSICPWKKEILDGLLGADLIGFHTQQHCNNFIETVSRELESRIDYEQFTVTRNNHSSAVRAFPISIAFTNSGPTEASKTRIREDKEYLRKLGITTPYIGVGVDRLDYTKGIVERFKAIEIFLNKYPQYLHKFTFIQIAAPSRSEVKRYQEYRDAVLAEVERINAHFKKNNWVPIRLLMKYHDREEIDRLYRISDFCIVASLHDGMNLVAKEYVAGKDDEKGVLLLSQFTGASKELRDALIINPYNADETADIIKQALEMKESEKIKRMRHMRDIIRNNNIYRWSAAFLKTLKAIRA